MLSSPELDTRVVRDAATVAAADRALVALRAFEAQRRATNIACKTAVTEAKRRYFATAQACGAIDRAFGASLHDIQNVDQVVALLLEKDPGNAGWGEPFRTPSIAWRTCLLKRSYGIDVDALPADVGESMFAPSTHCRRAGDRLLSSQFLARLTWLRRLERVLPFPTTPFTFLEMGGGYGALSRVVKLLHPQARIVLLDTPEGLFHQQAFLQAIFPERRHQYVVAPDEAIGDADFVYVPQAFAGVLASLDIFVAVHAETTGSGVASSAWLDLAQRRTTASHLFFLAPFLNRIGRDEMASTSNAADWSFLLDTHWSIRDWEADPDHERCPFFQTTRPRRLHLVASREADAGIDVASLDAHLETLRLEDWSARPGYADDRVVTGVAYPPMRSRADLDLTPDLTIDGTLCALWSQARRVGDADSLAMLITYLDYLNGQRSDVFFEELPMLVARHASLT